MSIPEGLRKKRQLAAMSSTTTIQTDDQSKCKLSYFYNEKGDYTITLDDVPISIAKTEGDAAKLVNYVKSITLRNDTLKKVVEGDTKKINEAITILKKCDKTFEKIKSIADKVNQTGLLEISESLHEGLNLAQAQIRDFVDTCSVTVTEKLRSPQPPQI